MKKLFAVLAAAAVSGMLNAENVWQADLSKNLGGFRTVKTAESDKVSSKDGVLSVTFCKGKIGQTALSQEIPFPEKGELSFDVMLNAQKSPKDQQWTLRIQVFGNMFAWNGANGVMHGFHAYRLKPKEEWINIGKPKRGVWVPVKVGWDKTKKTVSYYIGDLYTPAKTLENMEFKESSAGKGILEISNYGYATGPLEHRFRNIKVSSGDPAKENGGVIWQEIFTKNGAMEGNGFQRVQDNKKDQFSVKDGVLTMTCENSPYKGTVYQKTIPVTAKCEFSFDVKIAAAGSGQYNQLSLRMEFGNVLLSFRHPQLWVHRPSKNDWIQPCKVSNNEWHSFKIRFDAMKHTAEYYMDNMETPVLVDDACEFDPSKSNILTIGNYGLSSGTVINCLKNLKITLVSEADQANALSSLRGTMVFCGATADYWPLEKLIGKFGDSTVSVYTLEHAPHHVKNDTNPCDLQPKPPVRMKNLPKCIIFADMPLYPVPSYVQEMIVKAVNAGADFIVLNGFFTLNKGQFSGSELAKLLPVTIDDRWGQVQVKPGSKILKENGKTAAVWQSQGKGRVIVALERPVDPIPATVLFAGTL